MIYRCDIKKHCDKIQTVIFSQQLSNASSFPNIIAFVISIQILKNLTKISA